MKRSDLNFFIDIVMGITFLVSFLTGVIKFKVVLLFLAKIGVLFSTYWTNLIHEGAGLLMGVFVFIHLLLHFRLIKIISRNLLKSINLIKK